MLIHPNFDPVAIHLGPLKVHWYGIMYLIGFYGSWWIGTQRGRLGHVHWKRDDVTDLLFYIVMGVILGGRIGYTFFYNFPGFLADPLVLIRIWEGGMSFHGGLLGVIVAEILFARNTQRKLFDVADFTAVLVPFGLLTGRIGNFINGELWGAPTDLPWGMVFAGAGSEPRHPSMLYEAGLEGLVMLLALLWFSRKPRPAGSVAALFLILYAIFRSMVEFVRTPDAHIGYLAWGWVTMGQILSLPMLIGGGGLMAWTYWNQNQAVSPDAKPTR